MKSGREHRVPLTERAVEILRSAARPRPPVPAQQHGVSAAAQAHGSRRHHLHGFRSSFRDWAAETHDAARDVAEMALAHAVSDKTEAAYRRGDLFEKRRGLMADWAAYCCTSRRHRCGLGWSRLAPADHVGPRYDFFRDPDVSPSHSSTRLPRLGRARPTHLRSRRRSSSAPR